MAKDKEKSVNPAQQQRKLEKAKALKKSKADLQNKRNEKLAKRNPDRIQRQIDDLKALESAGDIKPREKAILADLERDLKAIRKARDALGDKAPTQSSRPRRDDRDNPNPVLGKRRHDGQRKFSSRRDSSGSDTDDSVRNIPWPRDTPPPVPKEWRRDRHDQNRGQPNPSPAKPTEVKTTYESAPQLRDLKKEAVSKFVPNIVKRKQDAIKGTSGQLLEPEEMDRLEKEGYLRSGTTPALAQPLDVKDNSPQLMDTDEVRRLKAEEEAFERELAMQNDERAEESTQEPTKPTAAGSRLLPTRQVEMEEVEDEDLQHSLYHLKE